MANPFKPEKEKKIKKTPQKIKVLPKMPFIKLLEMDTEFGKSTIKEAPVS